MNGLCLISLIVRYSQSLGWTAMPLFRENGNLMTGNWTIPVFWSPTSVHMPVDEIVQNVKR